VCWRLYGFLGGGRPGRRDRVGVVSLTARSRHQVHALDTVLPSKTNGGGHRGSVWYKVETQYEAVGGRMLRSGGWVVWTLIGRYRVHALGTGGSVWANGDAWFKVVGCRDVKIGWGWVILTSKGRYPAHTISTAWSSTIFGN
jgi:hypothetical protein